MAMRPNKSMLLNFDGDRKVEASLTHNEAGHVVDVGTQMEESGHVVEVRLCHCRST
jgi:hypothetical protein